MSALFEAHMHALFDVLTGGVGPHQIPCSECQENPSIAMRRVTGSAGEIAALKQELKLAQARIQELDSAKPQRRKAPANP